MMSKVVIVEYGTGNVNSIRRALDRMGFSSAVSSDAEEILGSDKIILPGVGHFGRAMACLNELGLIGPLNEAVLGKQTPILGICLGMELMAGKSEEGNARGLGWIDGEVVKFDIRNKQRYKIPHIGWNRIHKRKNSVLMKNIPDMSEFYFVHSYYLRTPDKSLVVNETDYETLYPSAIERANIFGVQYHPEKSFEAGAQLLKNFIEL